MLLDGEEVPAGEYTWMRLKVQADPDVAGDSYITIDGADCELQIPSGDERGLQMIRGFTIGAGRRPISPSTSTSASRCCGPRA